MADRRIAQRNVAVVFDDSDRRGRFRQKLRFRDFVGALFRAGDDDRAHAKLGNEIGARWRRVEDYNA